MAHKQFNLYHVTIGFKTEDDVIETLIGPVVGLSDAHALIVFDIEQDRARVKAAWLKAFGTEWPGLFDDIELKMSSNGKNMVVMYNHSDVVWYEIK